VAASTSERASRVRQAAPPATVRRRPGPSGRDVRAQLLDVAEDLFATFGYDAVSLRAVSAAADLTSGALHYHFASRDELLLAVLDRRRGDVNERARALLRQIESGERPHTVAALVEAIAQPLLELLREDPVGGSRYLRIVSQMQAASDPRIGTGTGSTTGQIRELYTRLPGVAGRSPTRWGIAARCLVHELAVLAEQPDFDPSTYGGRIAEVLDFIVAGLQQP
jgi:AcrR family transcriptional regulator